jgi:hypothetical protein
VRIAFLFFLAVPRTFDPVAIIIGRLARPCQVVTVSCEQFPSSCKPKTTRKQSRCSSLLTMDASVVNGYWKGRRHSEYTCLCNYVTWVVSYSGVGGIMNPRFAARGVSPWSRYVLVTCNHRLDSDERYVVPACSLHACMFNRETATYSFLWLKGSA